MSTKVSCPVEHVAYDGFLVALELVETEIFLKRFCKINLVCHIVVWLGASRVIPAARVIRMLRPEGRPGHISGSELLQM